MAEARRTLVKSPPELWAEISDPESLAKHLGAFGEIRIARVEPETTVAWEGDRARGTVELEASGWGTKVRLTAETAEVEVAEEPPPEVEEPGPVAAAEEPEAAAVEEEPVAEPEPVAEEPEPEPSPPPPEKRRGFFARLLSRRGELRVTTDASELTPAREPVIEVEPTPFEPEVVAEQPLAVGLPPVVEEPVEVEEPTAVEDPGDGEIRVSRLGDEEAQEVLTGALDSLGSAHHRPFSRG